jgi:hypothetical protein
MFHSVITQCALLVDIHTFCYWVLAIATRSVVVMFIGSD